MVSKMYDLNKKIESILNKMIEVKLKDLKEDLKNSAVICNFTDPHPVVPNETRWWGKFAY